MMTDGKIKELNKIMDKLHKFLQVHNLAGVAIVSHDGALTDAHFVCNGSASQLFKLNTNITETILEGAIERILDEKTPPTLQK